MLDSLERDQEEIVLVRNERQVARLVPEAPRRDALSVFGDLYWALDEGHSRCTVRCPRCSAKEPARTLCRVVKLQISDFASRPRAGACGSALLRIQYLVDVVAQNRLTGVKIAGQQAFDTLSKQGHTERGIRRDSGPYRLFEVSRQSHDCISSAFDYQAVD